MRVELECAAVVLDGLVHAVEVVLPELAQLMEEQRHVARVATGFLQRVSLPFQEVGQPPHLSGVLEEAAHTEERVLVPRVGAQRPLVDADGPLSVGQRAEHQLAGLVERSRGRALVARAARPALQEIGEGGIVADALVVRAQRAECLGVVGVAPQACDELLRGGVHSSGGNVPRKRAPPNGPAALQGKRRVTRQPGPFRSYRKRSCRRYSPFSQCSIRAGTMR